MAVIFGISALLIFLLAALVVDLGYARDVRRSSQNAADASSLAAANALYPVNSTCVLDAPQAPPCFLDAVKAAKTYAASNFGTTDADWSSCSDATPYWYPTGNTSCISFTDATGAATKPMQPTSVRVAMPVRDVNAGLGMLAGVSQVPVTSKARATIALGGQHSCGLCVIGSGVSDLGNGDITVNGGSVQVNGSVNTQPQGHMTATPAGTSTISIVGTASGNFSPAALGPPNAATVLDPLASLPLPPNPLPANVYANPCNQGPGRYGAYTVPTNTTCTLSPGLYVITGKWDLQANNSLIKSSGTGVTLYFTCGTPALPAACNGAGTGGQLDTKVGDAQLTANTVAGPYQGYAIIYDRSDTAGLNIQGNGNTTVTGTVYAVKSQLQFPGTSCVTVTNGPVIVGSLYGNGNTGCVNLVSVNSASLPPIPGRIYLDQ